MCAGIPKKTLKNSSILASHAYQRFHQQT